MHFGYRIISELKRSIIHCFVLGYLVDDNREFEV